MDHTVEDTLIAFGDAVKAIDGGGVGGYLVLFSGPTDPDLAGEFFTRDTDFDFEDGDRTTVYYHHGQDGTFKRSRLGQGVLRRDEKGVRIEVSALKIDAATWAAAQLSEREAYERYIQEMIEAGKLGWSSGTASHLVEYEPVGNATWIRRWPLRLDASVTPTPAEPRTRVVPLKSYIASLEATDKGAGIGAGVGDNAGTPTQDGAGGQQTEPLVDATKGTDMDEKQIAALAAKAVEDALAARDARAEAQRQEQDKVAEAIKAAVGQVQDAARAESDALKADYEEKLAEMRRLPGGAPAVMSMPGGKYDYLSPAEHSFVLATQFAAYKRGLRGSTMVSEDAIKALAIKAMSEQAKGNAGTDHALKALAIKSFSMGKPLALKTDEIMHTDLTSYGLEWVEHMYSTDLWEQIRQEQWVLNELWSKAGYKREVPDGFDGVNIKLESTDPTWYKVPEAEDLNATTGRPNATVGYSQFVTAEKELTVAKAGARVVFSGEMSEDSLIRFAPQALQQIRTSGGEQLEHAIIDGDTDLTINTNINDIAGTPAGTEMFTLMNGFRKLALITNTANSRDAGALTEDDFIETARLLGAAGMNAVKGRIAFISDMNVYWKALMLSVLKTRDVFEHATIESGDLTGIWGHPYRPSAFMHYRDSDRLANSAGKVDLDVVANNAYGAILCVRWDQWAWAWKRRMTIETERWPDADANQIVAMMRCGMAYRDVEACAISYNVATS